MPGGRQRNGDSALYVSCLILYQMLATLSRRLDAMLRPDPSDVPSISFQKDAVTVKVEYRGGTRLFCIYNQCYFMCAKLNPMPMGEDVHQTAFRNLYLKEDRMDLSRFTESRSTDNGMRLRIETEFTRAPATVSSFQMPSLFGGRKKEELVITWKKCDTYKLFPVDSSTSVENCDAVTVALNFESQTDPCLRLLVGHHEFRHSVLTFPRQDEILSFLWRDGVRLTELKQSPDSHYETRSQMHTQFEDSTHRVMKFSWMEYVVFEND